MIKYAQNYSVLQPWLVFFSDAFQAFRKGHTFRVSSVSLSERNIEPATYVHGNSDETTTGASPPFNGGGPASKHSRTYWRPLFTEAERAGR
jgi:hypothetical protein